MRIASLAPSVTFMLQELGVTHDIVACTSLCPLPASERRTKAVGSFSILHEEKIAAARPDIVITSTLVQEKGAERLRAAGFNVLHLDPRRLLEVAESYVTLADAIGVRSQGQKIQADFLKSVARLRRTMLTQSLTIYMEEWHEPPFVSGNWVPDLVSHAGGRAVLIEPGQPSRPITIEELTAADPAIIIQHVCLPPLWLADPAAHLQRQRQREYMKQQLCVRAGWEELRAVKAGQVYALDDTPFNMPTAGVLQGVEVLQEVLEKAYDYYQTAKAPAW